MMETTITVLLGVLTLFVLGFASAGFVAGIFHLWQVFVAMVEGIFVTTGAATVLAIAEILRVVIAEKKEAK